MKRRVTLLDRAERFTRTNLFVLLVNILGGAILYALVGRFLPLPDHALIVRVLGGAAAGIVAGGSFGLSMHSLIAIGDDGEIVAVDTLQDDAGESVRRGHQSF